MTESEEEAQPVKTTVKELLALKHLEDLVQMEGVKLGKAAGSYGQDLYPLSDADGNTISDVSALASLDEYADNDKTYTVTAIFEGVSEEGAPQLVILDVFDATGIDGISAGKSSDNATLYNIAGQKVDAAYKGIVIKNGKKVFGGK